ncbi:MAG: hypothetical protein OXC11_06485, partial [Rhodospirillales bacterium]|nr:hypothetical protein [Rhodospirillales bacterium]
GRGTGTLTLTPDGMLPIETDLKLAMGALGGRGILVAAPSGGGLEVAATSDALVVRTTSEETRMAGAGLAASAADVTRLRLGLEGSRPIRWDGGATLVPSFEVGVRKDGGDAENGFGADIGAGLAWTDPSLGITAEFRARGLLTHAADGFRERGYSGSLAWDPTPSSRRGPSLTLRQTVGAQPSGGMDALFGPENAWAAGAAQDGDAFDRRTFGVSLGYGFALFGGRWTGTPELGLRQSGARSEAVFGFGWRLEGAGAQRFELRLEGAHTQAQAANVEGGFRFGLRLMALW